jgi:hypothetical protein
MALALALALAFAWNPQAHFNFSRAALLPQALAKLLPKALALALASLSFTHTSGSLAKYTISSLL